MAVDSSCEVVCNGKFAAEDREGRSAKEQWVQLQLVKGRLMYHRVLGLLIHATGLKFSATVGVGCVISIT